ncbi:hypothetical protein BM1_05047 [Bipolaris maydis]|nr:hypothetical protein BM1_05047 [Bipolaris maydis]
MCGTVKKCYEGKELNFCFDALVFRSIGTEASGKFRSGMLGDYAALLGVGKGENIRVLLLLWFSF